MKNYPNYFFFAVLLLSVLLSSCYYNSEEYLYGKPGNDCSDTTVFTYNGGVQPILSQNCYTCHSNDVSSSLGGGVRLQDFEDVKLRATNGSLLGAITHSPGYSPMPKGGRKLDNCKIQVIKKWIDAGMLNN